MQRRTLLKAGLAAASALSLPLGIRQAFAAEPFTFYGLKSMSGAFASYGKFADMGSRLAVEQYPQLLGRPLVYKVIDTEGNAGKAVRKVQEAIGQDGARFFQGCTLSSSALAVAKEVNKTGGVFMTPVGADEVTGKDCNSSTFRWSVPTYGAVRETLIPLIKRLPEAKRWYTITPQYVFGEALLDGTREVLKEHGLELVGNSYHSLQEQEFSGYLTNAISAKPDVLVLLNFGSQSNNTLRQAVNFGMKERMKILLVWSAGLDQFQELGSDVLEGVYLGAQYWHQVDTPLNRELVKATRAKYGINPNYPLAADYISTKVMLDTIAATGSFDGPTVANAMQGLSYEGPTGKETIRAGDHQVIKDYYLMLGKPEREMTDKDDLALVVSSGQSFAPVADTGCVLS
ncbi:MAG TPA: branched-chain amino acid ABC transporter substrate-binding protein [Pseudomonas sp.]|jgi:branched-chain amino acid transport system substrate-binding protein|uniref:ABC transporter substrate-binding protein n=1 Tax=Pseudomonas helleri TaxID=1608996 RepID=A0A0J6I6N2_9PSED|nr:MULTISPECIES: ABC transporter substrate-binding protein [Pseudomonas]KMN06723.1 branched-chain amino acid ABC transporter substrate-binding protein [Pseudomonas helleri]KMN18373.1 branched-chain amino acid ABC transporter substrate-binding protein [Pseudomonas helleri]MQT38162.1 ABC transporter substrate-binding protein [Pseudomonas helleri]MQT77278.1 ABC transporter substrate-binding protein [Pseudomonas helleri]MQT92995.1 ABC transporter substrate-binding protein [Pseudomonas helleri]